MQAVIFTLFPFVYNYVHSLFPHNLCFRPYIIKFDTLDSYNSKSKLLKTQKKSCITFDCSGYGNSKTFKIAQSKGVAWFLENFNWIGFLRFLNTLGFNATVSLPFIALVEVSCFILYLLFLLRFHFK